MCKFLSAIVLRTREILCNPEVDSHEILINVFKVSESTIPASMQNFIRVEFTPPVHDGKPDYFDVENYTLRVDEKSTPSWFDTDMKETTIRELHKILRRMIVTDPNRTLFIGGAYIFGPGANVRYAPRTRILAAHKDAYLARADFSGTDLSSTDLSGTDLSGAHFTRADLSGANLARANLSGTYFNRANLAYTNITDADISYADFTGAHRFANPPAGWKIENNLLIRIR